jgi:nucleotide-binding universal stress UspA family protein
MIETILVPIDIARIEAGAGALKLAGDLAKSHGSKFILLNVHESLPTYVATEIPKELYKTHLSNAADRLNEIIRDQGLPDTTEVVVREGHPSNEILEYAKDTGVDLIVIASHDPGLADYFLGSVAARVVRHAHCSVLVARELEN